jgi:2-dehydropantoate 2-reductase
MKIVVVGPGAMGCLLAGKLAAVDHIVWLVDHDRQRSQTINRRGIRIADRNGVSRFRVPCTISAREIGTSPLVFLCVKSYNLQSAIRKVIPVLETDTIVVLIQNGLGNVERISSFVDKKRIVCLTTSHGATCAGPGYIRHEGTGPTCIASAVKSEIDKAKLVAGILSGAGLEVSVQEDIDAMIWGKLVINSAINPITAIYNVRNGVLLKRKKLRELMHGVALEVANVARAKGIKLPYSDVTAVVDAVCQKTAGNISSMLQDIRKGKRTEIGCITGAVIKEARKVNVPVPLCEMLAKQIAHKTKKGG